MMYCFDGPELRAARLHREFQLCADDRHSLQYTMLNSSLTVIAAFLVASFTVSVSPSSTSVVHLPVGHVDCMYKSTSCSYIPAKHSGVIPSGCVVSIDQRPIVPAHLSPGGYKYRGRSAAKWFYLLPSAHAQQWRTATVAIQPHALPPTCTHAAKKL